MTTEIPLSRTKIVVPTLRPEIMHRARLLAHFDDLLDRKLIIVAAPAGYGKTSLLVDFSRQAEMPVCWFSLDILDQDPQRFCAYLIAAIEQSFPNFGKLSKAALKSLVNLEGDTERLLSIFCNEINDRIDQHFVLVVDDFQFVDAIPDIRNLFSRFISLAGENCHIILSSRRLPTLPDITLLVARQQVGGFDMEELAFQPSEIRYLFEMNYGAHLDAHTIEELMEHTEGWITGLHLSASRVTSGLPDLTRAARATGVDLAGYLQQEILDPQPPEIRAFLLRTSMLTEFDADLCEAVFGKGDWKKLIKTVRQNNLFVLRVGTDGSWLRYHHLFQDFLQQSLQENEPDMTQAIQLRLAEVYEARGEVEKAYALLRQSGALERLIGLIERAGTSMILSERLITFRSWLDNLPVGQIQGHPSLLSLQGALLCALGDGKGAMTVLDQAILGLRNSGDLPQLTLALVRRAATFRLLGDYEGSLQDSNEVLRLSENKPALQMVYAEAERFKGISFNLLGRIKEAAQIQESALQHYQLLGEKESIARVQMELGMTYRASGNYSSACDVYQDSLTEARRENNPYLQANIHNSLGVLYHAQGHYEKAVREFEAGLECVSQVGYAWMEALILTSLGDLLIEVDEYEAAEQAYARAAVVQQRIDFQFLFNYLYLARARLARLLGQLKEARQNLNRVEDLVQRSGSNYERGLFHLERGCLQLSEYTPKPAAAEMEKALEYFQRGHYLAETAWSRIWLGAAFEGSWETSPARVELLAILETGRSGELFHSLLQVVRRSRPWLTSLQEDKEIAAALTPWMNDVAEYEVQLPGLRRRLRRLLTAVAIKNPVLAIRAFGKTQVRVNGKLVSSAQWKTASVRELFFYLLTAQRPQTKEEIGATLWPELDTAQLKLRFKNDLYRLRHALGQEVVLFEENMYRFNHAVDYDHDVDNFSNHLDKARNAERIEERIAHLRSAANLRVGPYLQDIGATWVLPERERLDRLCIDALKQLAESLRQTGSLPTAFDACQEALKIDPCREDIHRLAMQIQSERRDRLGVIWQYQACKDALHNELNVSLSRETEELYRKLVT